MQTTASFTAVDDNSPLRPQAMAILWQRLNAVDVLHAQLPTCVGRDSYSRIFLLRVTDRVYSGFETTPLYGPADGVLPPLQDTMAAR